MKACPHLRLILGVAALLLTTPAHAKHVKVILLGGQSNMIGTYSLTSELPTNLQAPQADVLLYNGGLTTLRPDGTWFGPQVTFGRTIADTFPLETFCLIKYAANGSSLLTVWNPTDGATYASFRTRVANGLAALTAAGHTYEIAGMLWTQGEADVGSTTPIYESALNAFIADIRSRYGQNLPFFVSRLSTAQTSLSPNGLGTIRAAQEYVAMNDRFTYLIDTDAMSVYTDNLHFNAAGQIALGQAFGQSYIASRAPDTTSPELALLRPTNGFSGHPATNNLVISFNELVVFGTGYITVRKTANGTIVEKYNVANPPANLSLKGATLTIDPTANLNYSTNYHIEIDPTAIIDPSGNSFAGFSGPLTWSFSTAAGQASGLINGSGITPTASEVNSSTSYSLMGTINGVGLNSSGEHGSGGKSEWLTGISGDIANGFISFDLGGAYVLDSMHVWNCTQFVNYGVKQLDIYVSDVISPGDPEGPGATNWTKIADNVLFPAAGTPNVGFDLETQTGISLPTTAVRHVRFEIDTRQQDASTGGYVGLAEVQFVAAAANPVNEFANWISQYPGVSGLTGFNDDSDHDGNGNGLENFFGTDPSVFTAGLISGGLNGNAFTFTHPLNANLASDISVTYYWSNNMGSFNADGTTVDGTRVDFVRSAPSGGMVTVTATTTGASIDKLFVKVSVTQN